MSDWDEIRRLAADFQRAQSAGATQKLSERNCIEIVAKLIELSLLDVIYTSDGKEYLTPQQLVKEVKDEVYVSGGRCDLVEVATALNVDFSHVENAAQQITKSGRDTHLILGQLVSYHYLDDLAREINEKLQQKGTLNIPSLTKEYNLPTDFLLEQMSARVGSIIEGFKDETDPKVILTQGFIARNRAKVRGVLSAVTRPTTCASIIARFGFQDRLFFTLADELIRTKSIPGSISGGRNVSKATYIPHSYAKSQNLWIDNFYASNGYLEYDSLSRLGISDPQTFLKKKFKDEKMIYLDTCCIGETIYQQIESSVEEAVNSGSWIDVLPLLPSVLSEEDEAELVQAVMKGKTTQALVLGTSTILSLKLVDEVRGSLETGMGDKAKKDVESGAVGQSLVDSSKLVNLKDDDDKNEKKDERRKKAAGGKAGGGAQGRETKTKSTKRKGGKRKEDDWDGSDEEKEKKGGKADKEGKKEKKKELEYKSFEEMREDISSLTVFNECPEEIFDQLASHLQEGMNRKYRELACSLYQATLAASLHNKKRSHSDLQEKLNSLFTSFRLSEKALHEFKNEDHKTNLAKHLLKATGTEILTEIFLYIAEENMIKMEDCSELSVEHRAKIIKDLPAKVGEPALKLHKSVAGSSAEDFLHVLESEMMAVCDVMLKKPDKKKDRQILFSHRHELINQLSSCSDAALCLHLAALILFQHVTGNILCASGKFVPSILNLLKGSLSDEQNSVLSNHQALVVNKLKDKQEEGAGNVEESMAAVKNLVSGLKKNANEEK